MKQHWQELIPVDHYIVRSHTMLQDYDRKLLTLLYQPLLGVKSFSLYMTLWSELEQCTLWGEESTHHSLMGIMQCSLKEIFHERLKLEGIGLLKTYVKNGDETRLFIYELQAPLTPRQFFTDGVLNIYLYNRIGKKKYHKLKRFFTDKEIDLEEFTSVTSSFNEVFQSIRPAKMLANMNDETMEDIKLEQGMEYIGAEQSSALQLTDEVFDFELFFSGLSGMIPKRSITNKVRDTISKLAFLYGIKPLDMQKIVMSAIDANDTINIEVLRKEARDWYSLEQGQTLPSLTERVQPTPYRTMENKKPTTKEEELIMILERISPKQLLIDISGGATPTLADLQIIENVIFQQKLHPGVVNVLIYYVMLRTDMKLSKPYVEKIASHWARKNIKTVSEAMELAIQEHRQYQTWAETKKGKSTKQKVIRRELLPEWLQDNGKQETKKQEQAQQSDIDEMKKELEKELKKYQKKAP